MNDDPRPQDALDEPSRDPAQDAPAGLPGTASAARTTAAPAELGAPAETAEPADPAEPAVAVRPSPIPLPGWRRDEPSAPAPPTGGARDSESQASPHERSPAASSPAPSSPALSSPALSSPALSSPALRPAAPEPPSPPTPQPPAKPPAQEPPSPRPPEPRRPPPSEPPPERIPPPAERPPIEEPPPEPPPAYTAPVAPEPFDPGRLAAAAAARADEEIGRSYRELVAEVERFVADGFDPVVLVGYPKTGKTHSLKALTYVLRGFEESAREELQRELAPGPTEQWPFYRPVSSPQGPRWVFVDIGGDLFGRVRRHDWSTYPEATAGMLQIVSRCRGLLLLVDLQAAHLTVGPAGFAGGMSPAERHGEQEVQAAHEELGFLDQFLLLARALRRERHDVEGFLRKLALAPSVDAALRDYRDAPRLEIPVAVLFTKADRLAEGGDFAAGDGEYLAPQGQLVGVAPFVARHLPGLFDSLLRHARRFKLDFVQSYVERPSALPRTPAGEHSGAGASDADGGRPLWFSGSEHLSVGLLPAVEFLERNLPPPGGRRRLWQRGIDTRTALRIHRRLNPGLWRGVEVDL